MPDLKTKIRSRLFRRASATAQAPLAASTSALDKQQQRDPSSPDLSQIAKQQDPQSGDSVKNEDQPPYPETLGRTESLMSGEQTLQNSTISYPSEAPDVMVQEPSPVNLIDTVAPLPGDARATTERASPIVERKQLLSDLNRPTIESNRKQSLIANTDLELIKSLLQEEPQHPPIPEHSALYPVSTLMPATTTAINTGMLHRKVWAKKAGGAATLVLVREDDLVDDVKEAILRKYSNNLGRHYDAPDITLRIVARDKPGERVLNPDESICRTLDSYYPNGQTVDEALLIDVPPKRTPRPSPRIYQSQLSYYYPPEETTRPHENGTDYFPPMPPLAAVSPAALTNMSHESRHSLAAHERALSVLSTGQVPPLPSPGGTRRAHLGHKARPSFNRNPTSSPTALTSSVSSRPNRPRLDSRASDEHKHVPAAPPLPTPPAQETAPGIAKAMSNPPTPRVSSPRPGQKRKPKPRPSPNETETQKPTLANHLSAYIDTSVPPINVLIVEDNHINMKLLEQFIRRLKVRWSTAVNGREAVNKWRQGGFHLVLMDIQLPIMSGIEATKEIRRLERVNKIGVFTHGGSSGSSTAPNSVVSGAPNVDANGELIDQDEDEGEGEGEGNGVEGERKLKEEDLLEDKGRLFKSPVIIVALTASNLQSDRHEALAAGCNDFLTKVRFPLQPTSTDANLIV